MRIACIGRWSETPADPVRAKLHALADEWRARGHEVELFALAPVGYGRAGGGARPGGLAATVRETLRLRRSVRRFAPDVLYVRYGQFVPSLAPLQRAFPTVVEINADDRAEAAVRGRRLINAWTRRTLLGRARGIVCVSRELARSVEGLGRPVCVIANGARLDVAPVPASASADGERPLAVFLVGVPMPWHGLDKLVALAHALADWDFAVVGAGAGALPDPPPANVQLHPPMARAAYAPLLARADVGIGSLALHRAGLREASPLKVREYLAHGLPVALAHEDTDLTADDWFVLSLPNEEENVAAAAAALPSFLERVRGRRVAREQLAPRVGIAAKEDARLAFMADVARGR